MAEKVYCLNCVFYQPSVDCKAPQNIERYGSWLTDANTRYKERPPELNKDNYCKWFSAKSDVKVTLQEDETNTC